MKKLIILSVLMALAGPVAAANCHLKLASGDYLLLASGDKMHIADETCASSSTGRIQMFIKLYLPGVF